MYVYVASKRERICVCMLIETHKTTPAKCNMTWIGAHSTAGSPDE